MLNEPIDPDVVEANVTQLSPDFVASDELRAMVAKLTNQQQATLHRVAVAYIAKRRGAISALFEGEDKVCAHAVFYRPMKKKPGDNATGWFHQVNYRAALNRYMLEYRPHFEKTVLAEAESLLKTLALKSVTTLADLIDCPLPNVALGAVKLAMDKIGLGQGEEEDKVTVIIQGAEWTPGGSVDAR